MNVFIGGSRAVSKLNQVIHERLDDLVRRGCTIFIGDANGADKAVQAYFAERSYQDVVVFCMEQCRNNVGSWPTRRIDPPAGGRGFAYYAAKDLAMSKEAQCGLMLWDAKSKGTLQNMLNLVGAGKRTLVYFAPTKDFHVLANEQDLQSLLALCQKSHLDAASRGLGLKTSLSQLPLSLSRP
ncbi:MAG: hypothetical protein WD733_10320 [Bryobacterales bacterium]